MKIFGIGLSRTGTSTLNATLNELGFHSIHFPSIEENIKSANYDLAHLEPFDALTDTPVAPIFKELDEHYPGSRFILTIRDKRDWLDSCEKYFAIKDSVERGTELDELNRFHRIYTYGCEGFNRKRFANVYDEHIEKVKSYFSGRHEDLLIVDVTTPTSRKKLHDFLGIAYNGEQFPHVNSIEEFSAKKISSLLQKPRESHPDKYALVTVCDAKYTPYANIMIESFLAHNDWFEGDIIVLTDHSSVEILERYLLNDSRIKIRCASADLLRRSNEISKRIPSLSGLEARFLALETFALTEYDRVVFLDGDILVIKNLIDLFELEADFSAAPDSCFYLDQVRDGVSHRKIDKKFENSYGRYIADSFNSGVMSISSKFLNDETYQTLLEFMSPSTWNEIDVPQLADQIILNRFFEDKVTKLSGKYNFVIFLESKIRELEKVLLTDVSVVHYAGKVKPWDRIPPELFDIKIWKWVELWRERFFHHVENSEPEYIEFVSSVLPSGIQAAISSEELLDFKGSLIRSSEERISTGFQLKRWRSKYGLTRKMVANLTGLRLNQLKKIEALDLPIETHRADRIELVNERVDSLRSSSRPSIKGRMARLTALGTVLSLLGLSSHAQTKSKLNPGAIVKGGIITSNDKAHRSRANKPSSGIDIDNPKLAEGAKADVRSPVKGTVTRVNRAWGMVEITDKKGNQHQIGHLDMSESHAEKGQTVGAGDKIGHMGKTATNKDHVHYQIRTKDSGFQKLVDPETYDFDAANTS